MRKSQCNSFVTQFIPPLCHWHLVMCKPHHNIYNASQIVFIPHNFFFSVCNTFAWHLNCNRFSIYFFSPHVATQNLNQRVLFRLCKLWCDFVGSMRLIWYTFKVFGYVRLYLGNWCTLEHFAAIFPRIKPLFLRASAFSHWPKIQPQFPFKWIDTHFMEIDASAMNTRKNEWIVKNDAKMQLFASIFDCVCPFAHEERASKDATMLLCLKLTSMYTIEKKRYDPKNVQNLIMRKHDHVRIFCCLLQLVFYFAVSPPTHFHILVRFPMYQSLRFYQAHQLLWNNTVFLHRNLFQIVYSARPSLDSFCCILLRPALFVSDCKFQQMLFLLNKYFFLYLSLSLSLSLKCTFTRFQKLYDKCFFFLLNFLFANNEKEMSICFSICRFFRLGKEKHFEILQNKPNNIYASAKRDRICFVWLLISKCFHKVWFSFR